MNGRPYGLQYNGNIYYYLLNAQGDVIRMLDSTGSTVASYEYDPFGNIITATGAMAEANPLRYRGYYYDRETGFYYLNSRYYDPKIGRFINADSYVSTGQGIVGYNMFAYCGNNPVNASDPMGESAVALEWWLEEMWWLCGADTVLPIGDLAYAGGIVILGLGVLTEEEKVYSSYSTKVGNIDRVTFSKAKGKVTKENPPTEDDGYIAPKKGPVKEKGKDGWIDKRGNVWVPVPSDSPKAHGGEHWDVQRGDGKGYINVYPGGKTRPGTGKSPILPFIK